MLPAGAAQLFTQLGDVGLRGNVGRQTVEDGEGLHGSLGDVAGVIECQDAVLPAINLLVPAGLGSLILFLNIEQVHLSVEVVGGRSAGTYIHVVLVRGVDVSHNRSRLEEEILQLVAVAGVEINVGGCRYAGMELEGAIFDAGGCNLLEMVVLVLQLQFGTVVDALDGAFHCAVVGLVLTGAEANSQPQQN